MHSCRCAVHCGRSAMHYVKRQQIEISHRFVLKSDCVAASSLGSNESTLMYLLVIDNDKSN